MKTIGEEIKGTQFDTDLDVMFRFNDGQMSKGVYNLFISIRDMKMFCDMGMKSNRHWRMKDVKTYFGVKGDKHKVLANLEHFKAALRPEE